MASKALHVPLDVCGGLNEMKFSGVGRAGGEREGGRRKERTLYSPMYDDATDADGRTDPAVVAVSQSQVLVRPASVRPLSKMDSTR